MSRDIGISRLDRLIIVEVATVPEESFELDFASSSGVAAFAL